jgi:tetratricopeptide (TPR) repeat protein
MKLKTILSSLLFVGCSFTAGAQTFPLMENSWQDPSFVKRFMGSYGIHSEIEPTISFEEQEQLGEIITLVETDVEAAIEALSQIIKPDSSAVFDYLLGQMYLQNRSYKKAIAAYKRAVRKFPEFLRAYKNLGLAHIQLNQCKQAVPYILKVMEMGAADGLNYGFLAHCYLQDEKYASALTAYKNARLFQPDNLDWRTGEAQASLLAGKFTDAVILLDELIMAYPENGRYWMMQANAFMGLENNGLAAANLEVVKRMDKASVQSLLLLGNIYVAQNMPRLAFPAYRAALQQNEKPEFKKIQKAFDYLISGKEWQDANSLLADIKRAYPNKKSKIMEAKLAIGMGNKKQAAQILQTIVDADPMNGSALLLLASNYWEQGDFERAEFMYERAVRLKEFAFEALRENARMAVAQNRLKHALNLLLEAVKIESDETIQHNIRILRSAVRAAA